LIKSLLLVNKDFIKFLFLSGSYSQAMKKIFKIAVIICPLINMGMIAFLAERNATRVIKEERKISATEQMSTAIQFVNVSAASLETRFTSAKTHPAPRSFFIDYEECINE